MKRVGDTFPPLYNIEWCVYCEFYEGVEGNSRAMLEHYHKSVDYFPIHKMPLAEWQSSGLPIGQCCIVKMARRYKSCEPVKTRFIKCLSNTPSQVFTLTNHCMNNATFTWGKEDSLRVSPTVVSSPSSSQRHRTPSSHDHTPQRYARDSHNRHHVNFKKIVSQPRCGQPPSPQQ